MMDTDSKSITGARPWERVETFLSGTRSGQRVKLSLQASSDKHALAYEVFENTDSKVPAFRMFLTEQALPLLLQTVAAVNDETNHGVRFIGTVRSGAQRVEVEVERIKTDAPAVRLRCDRPKSSVVFLLDGAGPVQAFLRAVAAFERAVGATEAAS